MATGDTASAKSAERWLERLLYRSRWIAAPIYLGLVAALAMILTVFLRELFTKFPKVFALAENTDGRAVVLDALALIDLALVANLVLIVILAGYENFVSKIDMEHEDERLAWMGTIDFSGLKLKLFASMVAITGIELLKAFMKLMGPIHGQSAAKEPPPTSDEVAWLVIIHATFLFTAVLAALTDWLATRSKANLTSGEGAARDAQAAPAPR